MVTIGTIGTVLLTVAITKMSNAAHNWPPVKSTSYLKLLKKLVRRHVIATPVIIGLLFVIPKTSGILGFTIDLIFGIALIVWSGKTVNAARKQKNYLKELAPDQQYKYTRIRLDPTVARKLGGTAIHYLFYCPGTQAITFPESKYKNRRKYYLLNLKFKPAYGPNYERLTYTGKPFTRKSIFQDPKTAGKSFTEVPTVAKATLESVKTSQKIQLYLHDEISERIIRLKNAIYQPI